MNRYIFFASPEEYFKIGYGPIFELPEVYYKSEFFTKSSKLRMYLHARHNFGRIANNINLPFKRIWYKRYFDEKYNPNDRYVFIFFTMWAKICSCGYMRYLRRNFPECKSVLFLQDINNARKLDMDQMKKTFDHIMVFERNFAQEHGLEYYPLVYSEGYRDIPMGERDIDLLFVGAAKGRYDFLKSIYDKLSCSGINCQFYLSRMDQEVNSSNIGIHIVDNVSYEENVRLLKRSKCVLDIIPANTNCNTLRVGEAMCYNNRILTNNKHILEEEYYSPELISVYTSSDDIDLDFLKKKYESVDYLYRENISPVAFLRYLDNVFKLS